jgi:sec-independent protein translocase protein TatC
MPKDAEGSKNNFENKTMTFWEHTEELSKRLKVVIRAFIIIIIAMFILPADLSFLNNPLEYYRPLVALIILRIREETLPADVKLIGLEVTDPIQLYVIASFILAVGLTAPIIAYEIYQFINPALYPNEKKDLYPFLISFSSLFIIGLVFGYKILTPYLIIWTLPFFSAVGAEMVVSIMDFYTLVLITTLAAGMSFTLPIFLVLLVKYGVFSTKVVTANRIYIYPAIYILTSWMTPDGGIIGDFLLLAPIILLLEGGLLFARRYEKKGEVRPSRWSLKGPKCKFCGETLQKSKMFCPKCGRSQK